MTNSTYEQPLPAESASAMAIGYYTNGEAVPGRWHIYPEMAAAGLWTTPSDLGRFIIGIQKSLAGQSNAVISSNMTRQMLTIQKSDDGLGVFVSGSGDTLQFQHDGRNAGFDAYMKGCATTGQGAVVMINANDDSNVLPKIVYVIANAYHWPGQ